MKRTYRYVEARGRVSFRTEEGATIDVPVVPGLLKHPAPDRLGALLADPAVARKYTHEALRRAPWSVVRRFPRPWLIACLASARIPAGRRRALEWLLAQP